MLHDCIPFVFELRTACTQAWLYLDYVYLYLHLYLRGTVHCMLAYCLVNPKN